MGAIKARFGVTILFCSLLIAISVRGWFWYSQLTDRIYASIEQQLDFALNAEEAQYDPVNHLFSFANVNIHASGLDVKATSLQLRITAPGWKEIGRRTFPVTIQSASFENASLLIDSPESIIPLFDFGDTSFHKGIIYLGQNSGQTPEQTPIKVPENKNHEFSFLSLAFHDQASSSIDIQATGTNDLSWTFTGRVEKDKNSLFGKLLFEQHDIARLFSDSGYHGEFNARFDVEWVGSAPVRLQGELQGDDGGYQSEDFSVFWNGWHLPNVELLDWQIVDSAKKLSMNNIRVNFPGDSILSFFNWLGKHPFQRFDIAMKHLQVNTGQNQTELSGFTDARFSLVDGGKKYHFSANPLSGGKLALTGRVDGQYWLAMENIVPESLGLEETIQLNHFADRHYNYSYSSRSGVGRLSFWQQQKLERYSLLERLLFDANGLAELTFKDERIRLPNLRARTGKLISDELETIRDMPFTYLSRLTDNPLQPYFEHIPGQSGLTPKGEANLAVFEKIRELRPGLSWQLETSFSSSEDWPGIARNELEQTLENLGLNTGDSDSSETREKLIEQLYLVTQKQRMPNVGLVKKEERVQQAEQWLVDSWPKNPMLIKQLQEERIKVLTDRLEEKGLPDIPVISSGQEGGRPGSWLTIK